jgi:acetyltransferase
MKESVSNQLESLFNPNSVAIIGASSAAHKWGAQTVARLLSSGFQGRIYPINPKEKEIMGLTAYPSLADVPGQVDVAVITVRAQMVPQAMKECVQEKVKGAIIISADFAETGTQGLKLQQQTLDIARQGGIRFVGPNCFGVFCATSLLNTLPIAPVKGDIGIISQSGSFTHMIARQAMARGHGVSKLISAGNQADLDVADYLEYLGEDPATRIILMYLEGIKDGRKLLTAARKIVGEKPVIVYKTGRNPESARVSMSHTATMTGEDRIFDAMCRQVGMLRAESLFGALDMVSILLKQPLPPGRRIGIQGTGGQCVILADTCFSLGMAVPELSDEDATFLMAGLDFPPHAPRPRNPVDFAGSHTALMDATVINNLGRLDCIDGIISYMPVTFHQAAMEMEDQQEALDARLAKLVTDVPMKMGKPVILIRLGGRDSNQELRISSSLQKAYESAGIPSYPTPEEAVKGMATLVEYSQIKKHFVHQITA